ncbi:MAG: TetR/AcrR family transcriptional regulator [Pseudomonadota bacterium]
MRAAIDLIAEHGYDSVKVEDIAARADVANATFFLHFPTKAALIGAFNDQVAEKIAERLTEFDVDAVGRLELLRAVVLDEWARNAPFVRRLVADAAGPDGSGLAGADASLVALVGSIIEDGKREGAIAAHFDADLVAQCLVAGWRAGAVRWAQDGDDAAARRANRQTLDLILNGATAKY